MRRGQIPTNPHKNPSKYQSKQGGREIEEMKRYSAILKTLAMVSVYATVVVFTAKV